MSVRVCYQLAGSIAKLLRIKANKSLTAVIIPYQHLLQAGREEARDQTKRSTGRYQSGRTHLSDIIRITAAHDQQDLSNRSQILPEQLALEGGDLPTLSSKSAIMDTNNKKPRKNNNLPQSAVITPTSVAQPAVKPSLLPVSTSQVTPLTDPPPKTLKSQISIAPPGFEDPNDVIIEDETSMEERAQDSPSPPQIQSNLSALSQRFTPQQLLTASAVMKAMAELSSRRTEGNQIVVTGNRAGVMPVRNLYETLEHEVVLPAQPEPILVQSENPGRRKRHSSRRRERSTRRRESVSEQEGSFPAGRESTPYHEEYIVQSPQPGWNRYEGYLPHQEPMRRTIHPKDSPLCRGILEQPMEKVKMPTCKYNGTTDPENHSTAFEQHMMLYSDSDAMWCKVFQTTLSGVAADWYKKLPAGSIFSFRQIQEDFVRRFISKVERKKTSGELMSISQRPKEPLREYLTRFNNESITIPDLQQEIAVLALLRGMQECEFKRYLGRKSFTSLGEALRKANEYIRSDELMLISPMGGNQAVQSAKKDHVPIQQHNYRKDTGRKEGHQQRGGYPNRQQPVGAYQMYTPLNTARATIYAINKSAAWRKPLPMDAPGNNKNFCAFHNDHGHYTEHCKELKDNIEELVRRGYLSQYRVRQEGQGGNNRQGSSHSHAPYTPTQPGYSQPTGRIEQAPPSRQEIRSLPETGKDGADRGKRPTVWVISGGPVHGGTVSGAIRNLEEHRHLVSYHSARKWPEPIPLPVITFTSDDCRGIIYPHDDPLVLELEIANFPVKRCLIDGGSSANIIFWEAFTQLNIDHGELTRVSYPVISFSRASVYPEGSIRLPVQVGRGSSARDLMVDFLVIKVPAAYNVIIGRPFIHDAQAVVSTYHLTMIYLSNLERTERVHGSQETARSCYLTAIKAPGRMVPKTNLAREANMPTKRKRGDLSMENFDERPVCIPRPAADGETREIELVEGVPERTVRIGADMEADQQVNLISLLRENADVFAFSADEMPGISPDIIVHRLNVDKSVRPVKQKKRNFSSEKNAAIKEEVEKLLEAGFIEVCDYPEWLANVVMVKKSNGSWRMCVDFTNLNGACPKDCYPLPRIDRLVDSTSGHALLSFLDAFSGYHQVSLCKADRKKAAFITDSGVYSYKAMPFGLKNAGATYQKLVDRVFASQKGRNIEVYVDDSIVKSRLASDHIDDLRETFETLRRFRMKLNPKKCVFGVRSGKFLGFLVSERGIDANPDKVDAIMNLPEPGCIKDVQKLTGRMAALTRFISKSADRALPFFNVLKQNKKFKWGETERAAFEAVKRHLQVLPTIARPEEGDTLQLYISASQHTVAAVLIIEKDKTQIPVYFVSHILQEAETRYSLIEKLGLAVLIAARKQRPYFDAHGIQVLTNYPLEKAMQKMDTSGRLLKWAIELSEFHMEYRPRMAIKAQALSDFIVEASYQEEEIKEGIWEVAVDGSVTKSGSGAGVIVTSPEGDQFEYAIKFSFQASNNEAEYEAAIAGIQICTAAGARRLRLTTDSQLVANQFSGEYETKEESMKRYAEKLKQSVAQLESFEIKLVPRSKNMLADSLSKLASSSALVKSVMMEVMHRRSTEVLGNQVMVITSQPEWYDTLWAYKRDGTLPAEKTEARRLIRNSCWFVIIRGQLYKRGFSLPLLRCISAYESARLIEEIHEGVCGNHQGGNTLALKCQRQGYYWPTMLTDAQEYVKKCEKCQVFSAVINRPANDLMPILNPIPFAQWGMDILGPFTTASGGRKYLIVAVDYFTKWIEAEPVAKITANQVKKFIWKGIITRFGLPMAIVMDHGVQFDCSPVQSFLSTYKVKFAYSSVCHPQSNGQAEAANKQILAAMRKKLDDYKAGWADIVPEILWGNRTTVKEATGESPFRLCFGSEAVIPAEVGLPTFRIQHYEENKNGKLLKQELDLLPEIGLRAEIRSAAYKQRISNAYNKRVKHRQLEVGDLVLRRTAATGKAKVQGKLTPNWEGPYQIWEEIVPGAFRLMDMGGTTLKNSWNASVLRKFYV
ncbi:uncharacterized protein [Spinacia oleracea]|uniref:Reverse transcriptase domain-containing protein n=1 Tax=Spinacia oleracea TaxID=3562 RepID=A0A9R0JGY3_SPIOL|nr:uncharacterized protein LOC110806002 [Spinacia oleracea]